MTNNKNSTKVVTGIVRLSYEHVWEPASINGSNPKYSASLIIPKSDKKTIDAINTTTTMRIISVVPRKPQSIKLSII